MYLSRSIVLNFFYHFSLDYLILGLLKLSLSSTDTSVHYLLLCDEYSPRSVSLERHLSVWVLDILAILSTLSSMSTASESFLLRPAEGSNGAKPSPLLEFWEQRSKFKSWIVVCKLYFYTIGLLLERKIIFAVEYFRDKIDE